MSLVIDEDGEVPRDLPLNGSSCSHPSEQIDAWQEKSSRPHVQISTSGSSISPNRSLTLNSSHTDKSMFRLPLSPVQNFVHSVVGNHEAIAPKLLRDKPEKKTPPPARMHVMDWVLGSRAGQYTLVVAIGIVIAFLGSVGWWAVDGTSMYPPTLYSCLWISYALIFDPGTQTSLWESHETPAKVLIVGITISIFGFVYMLTVLGMMVESIRALLEYLLKNRSRFVMTGHIVILGWSDKTVYLLKEMFLEADNRGSDRQRIIILANVDEHEMKQAIIDHCGRNTRHVVHTRRGCPYDQDELLRVSIRSASDIIVLGTPGDPRESDLAVVRLILGLAALPGENRESFWSKHLGDSNRSSGRVIAEVKCADTTPVLEALLVPDLKSGGIGARCEAIHSRSTINRMLCLMAVKPVVGDTLATLSSFDDREEIYCIRKPNFGINTFGEACRFFKQALCIGIIKRHEVDPGDTYHEPKVVIAPDDDEQIGDEDRLLLIADDEVSIVQGNKETQTPARRSKSWSSQSRIGLKPRSRSSTSFTVSEGELRPIKTGAESIHCAAPLGVDVLGQDRSGRVYIVIGWPDDFRDLMMTFDKYVRKGTQVHVLTSRSQEERRWHLNHPTWQPVNIEVIEYPGSRVSVDRLITLPLSDAAAVIILAEEDNAASSQTGGDTGLANDSAAVTCALMICGIKEGKYKGKERNFSGRIICEVLDPRTDRMLTKNQKLKQKVTFFRSNALETGLFAMAASEPIIFNTLVLLLSPTHDVGKLVSAPISKYTHSDVLKAGVTINMSFWELHESCRQQDGDLLIGWHRLTDGRTRLGCELSNRSGQEEFCEQDRLLVLKRPELDADGKLKVPRAVAGGSTPGHLGQEFRIWREGRAVSYSILHADLQQAGLSDEAMMTIWNSLPKEQNRSVQRSHTHHSTDQCAMNPRESSSAATKLRHRAASSELPRGPPSLTVPGGIPSPPKVDDESAGALSLGAPEPPTDTTDPTTEAVEASNRSISIPLQVESLRSFEPINVT